MTRREPEFASLFEGGGPPQVVEGVMDVRNRPVVNSLSHGKP